MRIVDAPDNTTSMAELDRALLYANGVYKYELEDNEKVIIQALYQKYDALLGNPDDELKSTLLKEDTNNALHEAYNEIQKKGRLSKLRNTLLLSIDTCPYCGISVNDELDHYLPQSKYKAMSVYSRNLIPICHTCNNLKRAAVENNNNNNNSSFYHAYFQVFPQFPLFVADVEFNDHKLVINFRVDKTHIDDILGNKLDFQVVRTALNNRLQKEANSYIFDLKAAIQMLYDSDNDNGVKNLFIKQSHENKVKYGLNFWKTSLTTALANCEPFCKGGFKNYFNGNS